MFRMSSADSKCGRRADDDAESIITNERYNYIGSIIHQCYTKKNQSRMSVSDKIDSIVTNRWLALPIFILVMALVYAISMGGWSISIGTLGTDWANDVLFGEWVPGAVDAFLQTMGVGGWLASLIQDGMVAGVGAVLGFVPQMLVLFFLLCILEDIGYMARIAFIMDRIFRRFGLSRQELYPDAGGDRLRGAGNYGSAHHRTGPRPEMTIMTTGSYAAGRKCRSSVCLPGRCSTIPPELRHQRIHSVWPR